MKAIMKRLCLLLLASVLISPFALGQARDYPNGPVKVIVPFPPGSGSDTSARFFGEQLATLLGQPFVIDNRPGANGAIAVAAVKSAPANGYTILMGSSSLMSVNPIVIKSFPYDPVKDFKPLSGLTRIVPVIVVAANSRIRTLADLVSAAKADKDHLTVGTFTAGYMLAQEWFGNMAGVKFRHIPYKGVGQVFTDLIGGQLDFTIVDILSAAPLLQAGKLHALAVSSDKRHADFPEVPTFVERGYPDYVNYLWNGFFVRTDTPSDITDKLAESLQKVLATSAAREYAKKIGAEILPLGPVAMRKYHLDDLETQRRIANTAGIKPE